MDTSPRIKARAHAGNETRARLINIGTEILSEKGFSSTGVEEILSKAGVPKGSFYYFFESKAKFGFAVIDNYEYLWAQKLTRLLRDPAVPPLERISNYISEGVRGLEKYAFRRGCLIGNMGQEMAALDDEFRSRILKVFNSWADYIVDCLNQAKERGEISDSVDVTEVSRFFWFAWEGAILQAKLERSVEPIEQFRSVMFKLIFSKGRSGA
jgi:TetR/AcrR family transcriptional regulator, transcriptional repressor for nem operon